MENAVKALEIAGSVLMAVLILSCIVFGYSKVREFKQEEEKEERILQASDFNKDFDAYDRDNLYGTDMFSISNKIETYNKKENLDERKQYAKINLNIKVNNQIKNAQYFNKSNYNENQLNDAYKKLSDEINKANKKHFGKSVSYWKNYGTGGTLEKKLLQALGKDKYNASTSEINQLKIEIEKYDKLINEQEDMARKRFECIKIEYDNNTGRIIRLEFQDK